ncbi:MAG: thiosulfate oxidation carrier complex protein SoxZ [Alphaproteobacteria bacterium]
MTTPTPRVRVPAAAKKGEVVEIKTMISHPMESGHRRNDAGAVAPRKIIKQFVCRYQGRVVFKADLHPAVAANPFLSFHVVAAESGTFEFEWLDDDGAVYRATAPIAVS